jgi:hypothetical protein
MVPPFDVQAQARLAAEAMRKLIHSKGVDGIDPTRVIL